ncbi:MAG: hypothetical protein QOC66_625 [Pseudonocardiales bacterium]|nr:hypothetical protein [Pseudonocardiales bacterium]
MGRIVVTEFVSLDGVMEDPGGSEGYRHGGWTFTFDRGPEGDKFKMDELTNADAQLLGRVTYDGFAAAWPSIEDDAGFAAKMNSMPKYVVSKTLRTAWNNTTILSRRWRGWRSCRTYVAATSRCWSCTSFPDVRCKRSCADTPVGARVCTGLTGR